MCLSLRAPSASNQLIGATFVASICEGAFVSWDAVTIRNPLPGAGTAGTDSTVWQIVSEPGGVRPGTSTQAAVAAD